MNIESKHKIIISFKNNHIYRKTQPLPVAESALITENDGNNKENRHNSLNKLIVFLTRILKDANICDIRYESIYNLCYKIVISNKGSELNDQLKQLIISYLNSTYLSKISSFAYRIEAEFHQQLLSVYHEYKNKILIMERTLLYFDNVFLTKKHGTSIHQEGNKLFYEIVISYNLERIAKFIIEMLTQAHDEFIKTISNTNESELSIDVELTDYTWINKLITMWNELCPDYYLTILEERLLDKVACRYRNFNLFLTAKSLCWESWVNMIYDCQIQENKIIRDFNWYPSKSKILSVMSNELVSILFTSQSTQSPKKGSHKYWKDMVELITNNKESTWLKLVKLTKYNYFKECIELYGASIEYIGTSIIQQFQKNSALTPLSSKGSNEKLFLFYSNMFDLLDKNKKFQSWFLSENSLLDDKNQLITNTQITTIILEHLSSFINSNNNLLPKSLPKYLHWILTSTGATTITTEKPWNYVISNSFWIFKCIIEKDIFELFFRKYFGLRLLYNTFKEENEFQFLSKMKIESGSFYLHKCDVMYNDINTSKALLQAFAWRNCSGDNNLNRSHEIKVLTMANWNIPKSEVVKWSKMTAWDSLFRAEYSKYSFFMFWENYSAFYKDINNNKFLYLSLYHGQCELNARFKDALYSLIFTPIQGFVCILFNNEIYINNGISLEKILEILNMSTSETSIERLKKSLKPLISLGLITYKNNLYSLNIKFENKRKKIIWRAKQDIDGDTRNTVIINNQRKVVVESNLIRIWKSKQRILHNELISELLSTWNGNFIPDIAWIKNRIESLIERRFIQREQCFYWYVA